MNVKKNGAGVETSMNSSLSRRSFLKGSIVLAVGALGGYALSGCAGPNATANADNTTNTAASTSGSATNGSQKVVLHRGYYAGHGDKCFTQAVVAVDEEGTIVAVNIDDYQYMASTSTGIVPVPNGDGDFGAGAVEGMWLMSKRDNSEVYSKLMAEKGGATQKWADSMAAIEAYAVGKKPEDLQSVKTDAVSGATLVDTANYLAGIAQLAKDNSIVSEGSFEGDGSDLKIGRVNEACHGTKAFGDAVSLVQGDVIVATSIDEFQYMDASTPELVSVPNSDGAFAENYAPGMALTSKSANSKVYSKMMAEKAQATTPWLTSMQAIEAEIAGKKIAAVSISGPDAVSGATLVDTANYAKAAVSAAQVA